MKTSYTGASGSVTNTSYDDQDRMVKYGENTYQYSANGELQAKTGSAATTAYEYDVLGNLKSVNLADGTKISYVVDGTNRRIGRKVNGVLQKGFLNQDGLNPVAELDSSNNVVSRFVYGTRANVPDYMIKDGVTYRIISDHLGSVRLVVNASTGDIVQKMDYDEFGRVLTDTNPGFQPFGFAGGLYDTQTGLVRFGARDYDSETGRWTGKDPIGLKGEDTDLYSYVGNDPMNLVDFNGLLPFPINKTAKPQIEKQIKKSLGKSFSDKEVNSLASFLSNKITMGDVKLFANEKNNCGKRKVVDKIVDRLNQEVLDQDQNTQRAYNKLLDNYNKLINDLLPVKKPCL